MHDRLLAAAPIILICARRGLCRHASVDMQNGGSVGVLLELLHHSA
jgi:hypothetical protein